MDEMDFSDYHFVDEDDLEDVRDVNNNLVGDIHQTDDFDCIRIVVCGPPQSGKSRLTLRYVTGLYGKSFIEDEDAEFDRKVVQFKGQRRTLEIHNFRNFDPTLPIYDAFARDAEGFLFVADANQPAPIEMLDWLWQQISNIRGENPIRMVIVANKCDNPLHKPLWHQDCFDIPVIEASAQDNRNVRLCFEKLLAQICDDDPTGPAEPTPTAKPKFWSRLFK